VTRLWLPYEVRDLAGTEAFLTGRLGLVTVDSWDRAGESGRVLAFPGPARPDPARPGAAGEQVTALPLSPAGAAVVELVTAAVDRALPPALELADRAAVDAVYRRLRADEITRPPGAYPRGHYGFEARTPGGLPLMIWSER
jgi:hypothetical protein